jgi:hypothetical protein
MRILSQFLLPLALCALGAGQALADSPESASQEAAAAMQAGDAAAVISLLSPPPVEGADTCTLANALSQKKQNTRALLYFERCFRATSDNVFRKQIIALKRTLQRQKLAPVSLSLSPENARASIDSVYSSDDILLSDEDLWLAKGSYRIELSAEGYESAAFAVTVESSDRMLVPLTLEKAREVNVKEVDLGEGAGNELGSVATTADPRPKKFKNILPDRYTRAPDPSLQADGSDKQESNALPWITLAGGVGLIGAGVGLHVSDRNTLALVSYGLGGSLLGMATYLFLQDDDEASGEPGKSVSISATPQGWCYGISGTW